MAAVACQLAVHGRPQAVTIHRPIGRRARLRCGTCVARPPRCGAAPAAGGANKDIIFIRHGTTEMNEHLGRPGKAWGSPGFVDPGLLDTRLTPRGVAQARALGEQFLADDPGVELLCCSPLTRALQTASLAFAGGRVSPDKRVAVCALAAERLYLSSDVGRPVSQLRGEFLEFAGFEFEGGEEASWWYTPPESGAAAAEWRPTGAYTCPGEPQAVFDARLELFKRWLAAQPESRIAVVAHWGVIRALTHRSLANCEVTKDDLRSLLDRPLFVGAEDGH